MYTRREICALTGIPEGQFKNLVRRDQLPFVPFRGHQSEEYLDSVGVRGWNRFSALDVLFAAVQYRLMEPIGYADGLGPETARDIVSNNGGAIGDLLLDPSKSDQWIGYVGQPIERGGRDGGVNVYGTIIEVAAHINARCFDSHEPDSSVFLAVDPAAERVFLVNVSEVLRAVKSRALAANIAFPKNEN